MKKIFVFSACFLFAAAVFAEGSRGAMFGSQVATNPIPAASSNSTKIFNAAIAILPQDVGSSIQTGGIPVNTIPSNTIQSTSNGGVFYTFEQVQERNKMLMNGN